MAMQGIPGNLQHKLDALSTGNVQLVLSVTVCPPQVQYLPFYRTTGVFRMEGTSGQEQYRKFYVAYLLSLSCESLSSSGVVGE